LSLRDHTEERRRLYARMSGAELRQINRHDLSDLARKSYDDEVARRGLDLKPSGAAEPEQAPGRQPELVSVATFVFPDDAKLARALLESAAIPAYLENEHTLAVNWMLTNAIGGLHLLVPAAFAEEARAILSSRVSDQDLAAQAEAAAKPPDV
jgi:hypothetical protein